MMVTLDEIKQYLRIELTDTNEDTLLDSLIAAAEDYVKNATGFKFDFEVPELAKIIIKLLVSHWYDNRSIVSSQQTYKIDFTINTLLAQLSYSYTSADTDIPTDTTSGSTTV